MLEFFHYLHITGGILIGGAEILIGFVIYPAMLKLDPEPRRDFHKAINQYAGPFMGIAVLALLVGAIGRVWVSGVISGFGDLFYGYGLMVTIALVVLIAWQAFDVPNRAQMTKAADALDNKTFTARFKRGRVVSTTALIVLIGIMGALRLGLY